MDAAGQLLPDRARRRLRRRRAAHPRGPRRRRLRAQRGQAVHLRRGRHRPLRRDGPHRRATGPAGSPRSSSNGTTRGSPSAPTSRRWAGTPSPPARSSSTACGSRPNRCSARRASGFSIAMTGLDGGRLNIAACSLGGAQSALDRALAHLADREAFGAPLARRRRRCSSGWPTWRPNSRPPEHWCGGPPTALDAEGARGTGAVRDGQALRHRRRVRRRRPGAPAARRLRLPGRVRHREDRARPAGPPDPGRDQRDHARHRGPRA